MDCTALACGSKVRLPADGKRGFPRVHAKPGSAPDTQSVFLIFVGRSPFSLITTIEAQFVSHPKDNRGEAGRATLLSP
jgi:hypothetical protein